MRAALLLLLLWPLSGAELRLRGGPHPVAWVGLEYNHGPLFVESAGRCPQGAVAVRVVDGEFPPGLSLDAAGYVSGVAQTPGVYTFTLEMQTVCTRAMEQVHMETAIAPVLRASQEVLHFKAERGGTPPAEQQVAVAGNRPGIVLAVQVRGAPWLLAQLQDLLSDSIAIRVNPEGLTAGEYRGAVWVYTVGLNNARKIEVLLTVQTAGASLNESLEAPKVFELTAPHMPLLIVPPASLTPAPVVLQHRAVTRPPQAIRRRKSTPPEPAVPRSRVVPLPKLPKLPPRVSGAKSS